MNQEVEIQAKIKNPKEVEAKLLKLGKFIKSRKQIDKYYVPFHKNFFKQNPITEYLRVRYENGSNHFNYSFLPF